MLPMFHTGQALAQGRPVALEFACDDHPRHIGRPLHKLAEASLRRLLVSLALHQDIEDVPVLVDGPPQVVAGALDGQKDLV